MCYSKGRKTYRDRRLRGHGSPPGVGTGVSQTRAWRRALACARLPHASMPLLTTAETAPCKLCAKEPTPATRVLRSTTCLFGCWEGIRSGIPRNPRKASRGPLVEYGATSYPQTNTFQRKPRARRNPKVVLRRILFSVSGVPGVWSLALCSVLCFGAPRGGVETEWLKQRLKHLLLACFRRRGAIAIHFVILLSLAESRFCFSEK